MIIQVEATIVGGMLKLERELDLPDQTRVRLTIEPAGVVDERAAAFTRLSNWIKAHPIDSGGSRFTRDELHERR